MAVTLPQRVYNPAAALGSLSRAGGQLGSRSAATRCCHSVTPPPPTPGVPRTLRSPRDHRDQHLHPHGEGLEEEEEEQGGCGCA